jgi:hypothetical protein
MGKAVRRPGAGRLPRNKPVSNCPVSEKMSENGEAGATSRLVLIFVPRNEDNLAVLAQPRRLFERHGEVNRVERAEPMVEHEPVRGRQDDLRPQAYERHGTTLAPVGVDSSE